MADYPVKQFYGTATTVISLAAALANNANTWSGHAGITQTPLDNSVLNYPKARAVLTLPTAAAAAYAAGSTFDLYMTVNDVDGTTDETPVPAATDIIYRAKYCCSFVMDNDAAPVVDSAVFSLEGVKNATFYLMNNNTGQSAAYTATPITVKVTPFTDGVTA